MGKLKNAGGRKLVVLSGKTKGTAFVLTKPEVNAGRDRENAICLKGKRVSRYHVVLVRTNGEYTLRDVSPQIGTFLNGRRTKEKILKLGDRIRIGEFEMSYEAATEAAAVIDVPPVITPATIEEVAAPQEPLVDLSAEHQQRIAELTERLDIMSRENVALKALSGELQAKISEGEAATEMAHRVEGKLTRETERLAGELKLASETLESVRAELQTQSEQRADLMERLGVLLQDNATLMNLNRELQAKLDAKMEPVVRAQPSSPSEHEEKQEPTESTEIRVETGKIGERIAPAVLGKRDISDPTGEQFDKIRRSIVEKKSLQKPKTMLERFLLPFRDMRMS